MQQLTAKASLSQLITFLRECLTWSSAVILASDEDALPIRTVKISPADRKAPPLLPVDTHSP